MGRDIAEGARNSKFYSIFQRKQRRSIGSCCLGRWLRSHEWRIVLVGQKLVVKLLGQRWIHFNVRQRQQLRRSR